MCKFREILSMIKTFCMILEGEGGGRKIPLAVLFEYLDGKDILSMFVNRIKIMWRTS